jgi:hypothetical protein
MELNFNEIFLIEVLRDFSFLVKLGYEVIAVSVYGRDPFVIYQNSLIDRKISISWEGDLLMTIERSRKLFPLKKENSFLIVSNYYEFFGIKNNKSSNPNEKISMNATLLQTKFIEILKGNSWIEEILNPR